MASRCDSKSVIVIGGGVAGLTVASKLKQTRNPSFDVTVLEAGPQIGGRVQSFKLGTSVLEMGAHWIHGEKGNSVYSLTKSADLIEEDTDLKTLPTKETFVTQSGEFLSEEVNDRVDSVMTKIHGKDGGELKKGPLGEYAARVFWNLNDLKPVHKKQTLCHGVLDYLHRYQNTIDGSDNWFQPSCEGQLEYKRCEGKSTIPWKAPATYSTLFDLILYDESRQQDAPGTGIPEWIHLNKEVTGVHYSPAANERVTVSCRDGTTYEADHVICTVALGVLKHNHSTLFHPMLPRKKVVAIESFGFGSVDKIYITFENTWWPETTSGFNLIWEDTETVQENWLANPTKEVLACERDGIPIWCRSLLGFYTRKNSPNTLVAWITGPPARFMEELSQPDLKRVLVTVLNRFLGKVYPISKVTDVTSTKWGTNSFTQGSYTFRSVDCDNNNAWATDLAEPVMDQTGSPVICFAGEATHSHYFSTVHGAYDSGVREAERLTQYYQNIEQRKVNLLRLAKYLLLV